MARGDAEERLSRPADNPSFGADKIEAASRNRRRSDRAADVAGLAHARRGPGGRRSVRCGGTGKHAPGRAVGTVYTGTASLLRSRSRPCADDSAGNWAQRQGNGRCAVPAEATARPMRSARRWRAKPCGARLRSSTIRRNRLLTARWSTSPSTSTADDREQGGAARRLLGDDVSLARRRRAPAAGHGAAAAHAERSARRGWVRLGPVRRRTQELLRSLRRGASERRQRIHASRAVLLHGDFGTTSDETHRRSRRWRSSAIPLSD